MKYTQNWDLSQILNGSGSDHKKITEELKKLEKKIQTFSFELPGCIVPFEQILSEIREAGSLIACITSVDVTDSEATALEMQFSNIAAQFADLELLFDQKLAEAQEETLDECYRSNPDLKYPLQERRKIAAEKLPLDKEALINTLSVSGFHSMCTLYYSYIGELEFPLGCETMPISKIESELDVEKRSQREAALHSMETTFKKHEAIFSQLLNNLIDYRLKIYEKRGYSSYLHETLQLNRTKETTINAMWTAISNFKEPLKAYMDAKARLLKVDKLAYYDLSAPLSTEGSKPINWESSCNLIVELFEDLSPKMGAFAKKALQNGWIDAAISEKKRAGGFCVDIPLLKESRVLMSFNDTTSDQSTLAHELGHAYHNEVLCQRPALLQHLPMSVAETASTMCEMIVADNAVQRAKNDWEKLSLLNDKISRSLAFCMDLHSRFILDKRLHEERKKGFITPSQMAKFTEDAQKEGFANNLSLYFPHFFCYKMHFYLTDAPFYNWPYTFGYLLSLGLYQKLRDTDFEKCYNAFLYDTGAMGVEDLVQKHLGIDLTKPDFWESALALIKQDIDLFLDLAKKVR